MLPFLDVGKVQVRFVGIMSYMLLSVAIQKRLQLDTSRIC